jgi:NADPH:quinone reductase-like Zn-dependent oxidoreductase
VKSLGADAVFDYKDPAVGKKINEYTKNKLYYIFDTFSEGSSPAICAEAFSTDSTAQKPVYGTILNAESPRKDVQTLFTLGYTVVGESFTILGNTFEAKQEDFEFAKEFMALSQKLIEKKIIKPHRVEINGGLDDILTGLKDMKEGKVSGKKVVYVIGKE